MAENRKHIRAVLGNETKENKIRRAFKQGKEYVEIDGTIYRLERVGEGILYKGPTIQGFSLPTGWISLEKK